MMSEVAVCAESTSAAFVAAEWLRSHRVRDRLVEVESRLLAHDTSSDPWTTDVCTHLLRGGGKRLRPSLLLLAAEVGGRSGPPAIEAAVAIELLHVATLYHDDVSDEAGLRRGRPSANRLWGNGAAVFAGIRLFSGAIERITTCGEEATRLLSASVAAVWKGQMQETENIHDVKLDEATYFDIIRQKTAAMCELPCRLGALLGGLDAKQADALAVYGQNLGCAFQIVDDVLDIVGDGASLGKTPGIDLLEGIYTFPILYALRLPSADARLEVILRQRNLSPDELRMALALVRQSGAIAAASRVARQFAALAVAQLRALPSGPVRDSFKALAHTIVNRARIDERGL